MNTLKLTDNARISYLVQTGVSTFVLVAENLTHACIWLEQNGFVWKNVTEY